jgi:hypothetical protein
LHITYLRIRKFLATNKYEPTGLGEKKNPSVESRKGESPFGTCLWFYNLSYKKLATAGQWVQVLHIGLLMPSYQGRHAGCGEELVRWCTLCFAYIPAILYCSPERGALLLPFYNEEPGSRSSYLESQSSQGAAKIQPQLALLQGLGLSTTSQHSSQ